MNEIIKSNSMEVNNEPLRRERVRTFSSRKILSAVGASNSDSSLSSISKHDIRPGKIKKRTDLLLQLFPGEATCAQGYIECSVKLYDSLFMFSCHWAWIR
jgi:hypothetical protein